MPEQYANVPALLPTLSVALLSTGHTITVNSWTYDAGDTTGSFRIKITEYDANGNEIPNDEIIYISSRSGNVLTVPTSPEGRGYEDTTAMGYAIGAVVRVVLTKGALEALPGNYITRGVFASRPAAGRPGAIYIATDVDGGTAYHDNGTSWVQMAMAADAPLVGNLDDLDDVNAPAPTDGQVLTYEAGSAEWIAADPTGGAGGGGGGLPYKQTVAIGTGNKTTTSTSFTPIDSTNLGYLTLDCQVGDIVELLLSAQFYATSGTVGFFFGFEVDRPTSANEDVYSSAASGGAVITNASTRDHLNLIARYEVGEAGVHGFRPVWKVNTGTGLMANDTSGNDDSAIVFGIRNLGPAGGVGGGLTSVVIGASVYHSTTQTSAADVARNFDSEEWDTHAFHDTSTNNSRLTVPAGQGGTYLVRAMIRTGITDTDYLYLTKNGSEIGGSRVVENYQTNLETIIPLVSGDYVQVHYGGTGSTGQATVSGRNTFQIIKLASGLEVVNLEGTYASRPAAGVQGRLYLPSDSILVALDDGSAWKERFGTFPVESDDHPTSWVNQGGASVDTTRGGEIMVVPAQAGQNIRIRDKAAPSTPYTIEAGFMFSGVSADYELLTFGFREASSGKLDFHHVVRGGSVAAGSVLNVTYASGPTASIADRISLYWGHESPIWLQISDDGTNRIFRLSSDRFNWITYLTISRTDYLTADRVFWGGDSRTASYGGLKIWLIHWREF